MGMAFVGGRADDFRIERLVEAVGRVAGSTGSNTGTSKNYPGKFGQDVSACK